MPDERFPRSTPRQREKRRDSRSGLPLIAVQSLSCVVIILIALVMRFAGGEAFQQLRQSFSESLMSNSLMATLSALVDQNTGKGEETDPTTTAPAGETTAPSETEPEDTGTEPPSGETDGDDSAAATTAAMGGQDLDVTEKKAFYAPEGATFAPLKVNAAPARPLENGTVTSYFGYRENPTQGGESFHQGLDIAAEAGSSISSLFFGVVTETGANDSYGNYIVISHGNGLEVLYAHCSQILAAKDAVIRAGETVARVGTTGDSTGNHLHIEVRLDGVAYDPADVVPLEWYA